MLFWGKSLSSEYSSVSGHYHDISVNPLNGIVQQFAVQNKNCLVTGVPLLFTALVVDDPRCLFYKSSSSSLSSMPKSSTTILVMMSCLKKPVVISLWLSASKWCYNLCWLPKRLCECQLCLFLNVWAGQLKKLMMDFDEILYHTDSVLWHYVI